MNLGDELATALPELREQARSRMRDACTVRRVTGNDVDDDGNVIPTYSEPLYEGACRVQAREPQEGTLDVAGVGMVTVRPEAVHIPVGGYAPEVGDVVTVDTATDDPHLAGRTFRVVALLHKSQATAYRLGVTEVS